MKTQIKLEITRIDLNEIVHSEVYESETQVEDYLENHLYDHGNRATTEEVLKQEYLPEVKEIQIIEGEEVEVIIQEEQLEVYETVEVPSNLTYEIKDISQEVYDGKIKQLQILNLTITEDNRASIEQEIENVRADL